jgi:phenylacetate-CoA ligase
MMGADCSVRQGLHVFSDIRHVELLRTNTVSAANESGEVVVTDLTNYVFPLLRYRTGDTSRAIDTPCPCGRAFPLIEYVQGRISDTIYLSDGTPVPGEFWTTIFDDHADSIRSFRVHQNSDCTIDIFYEGGTPASASAAAPVLKTISGKLVSSSSLRVSQGTGASNDGGKLRFVTSDMRLR